MYCSNWRQNSIHGTLYQLICSCFIAIIKFFTGTLVTKHIIASLHVSVHHMGLVFNLLLGLLHCHRLLTVICFLRFNAYLFTYFVSLKQTTNSFTETKVRKFSNHKIQILETHEDSPYYYGGCINSGVFKQQSHVCLSWIMLPLKITHDWYLVSRWLWASFMNDDKIMVHCYWLLNYVLSTRSVPWPPRMFSSFSPNNDALVMLLC